MITLAATQFQARLMSDRVREESDLAVRMDRSLRYATPDTRRLPLMAAFMMLMNDHCWYSAQLTSPSSYEGTPGLQAQDSVVTFPRTASCQTMDTGVSRVITHH